MDPVDYAQAEEERQRAAALEIAAAIARTVLGGPATSTTCQECGGEIEPVRITYGFSICAMCAKDREYFAANGRTYR